MDMTQLLTKRLRLTAILITLAGAMLHVSAATIRTITATPAETVTISSLTLEMATAGIKPDDVEITVPRLADSFKPKINIYQMPYSRKASYHDWHRLWINTGVLAGAYVGTLLFLQTLPEDATS